MEDLESRGEKRGKIVFLQHKRAFSKTGGGGGMSQLVACLPCLLENSQIQSAPYKKSAAAMARERM